MAPGSKAEQKAALDAGAWMFNVVTSVGIIMVNKALMATHGFSFGKNIGCHTLFCLSVEHLVSLESQTKHPAVFPTNYIMAEWTLPFSSAAFPCITLIKLGLHAYILI
jgi:hypothetical protein